MHPKDREYQLNSRLPGYRIERHPRCYNKPLACQSGLHKHLEFRVINGMLCYYCRDCGGHIGQGIHDGTWSSNDMHRIKETLRDIQRPRTRKQCLEDSVKAMELLRKRFTDKEISMMIEKRRRGLR